MAGTGLTERRAQGLLAAVIVARSASYLFSKVCLQTMGTFTLMGLRFALASAVLAALFWRRLRGASRRTVGRGALLGLGYFAVMTCEFTALKTTEASTASFLENTAIVLVPLLDAALRRRAPEKAVCGSMALALGGVALLTLRDGLEIAPGALMCLLGAGFYAGTILLTDRFSRREDPLTLGVVQVMAVAALAFAAAVLRETPRLPRGGTEWGCILALALVCSGFGFTLQPMAQSRVSAERAGQFCALSPLSAAILSRIFLGERLGVRGLLGAALVLAGVLLAARRNPEGPPETEAEPKTENAEGAVLGRGK